ncbi:MAG: sigma factor [Planctomycetota bacterium]
MNKTPNRNESNVWDLRQISTQWSAVSDANFFVLRYVDAIRHYLNRLLQNEDDVEDVLQQFLVKVIENGFERADPDKGRFRHYLIRAIRNEVVTWQRKRSKHRSFSIEAMGETADGQRDEIHRSWDDQWYQCVLKRCWKQLRQHQAERAGNLAYSVLSTASEHVGMSSEKLARRVSEATGQPLGAAAFRKQLSRARRVFAESIIKEVSETLEHPTPESVQSELRELGLIGFVSSFFPESWKESEVDR